MDRTLIRLVLILLIGLILGVGQQFQENLGENLAKKKNIQAGALLRGVGLREVANTSKPIETEKGDLQKRSTK